MAKRRRNGWRQGLLQRLLCRFGKHHRDRDNVRRENNLWTSVCTGCGLAMVKIDQQWAIRSRTRAKRGDGADVPTF